MSETKVTAPTGAPASAENQSDVKSVSEIPDKAPDMKEVVNKVIKESDNLVTALEAVGALYGIPSENIIVDDSLRTIKVVNDNIIAPSTIRNTIGNTKAIVCSIGSVLDYISQRIDDKLNDYQKTAISDSKKAMVRRDANPAKGNVVGRYTDNNGDEVIVYDTGLIDMANTREAQLKVDELRQDLKIPMYSPAAMKQPSYFSDEDDITAGVDMNAGSDAEIDKLSDTSDIAEVDVSKDIQESFYHIDLVSKFNNTRHLGYDLLTSQGFDYVKPVDIIQESATSEKKESKIDIKDIKHMKFDNTNIIKAIKYMNDARSEQTGTERGSFSVKQLINNKNWQKAIDCLNKQFDARINIRFINTGEEGNKSLFTSIWNDIKTNLVISKSKGFQLNGLAIDIFVIDKSIDEEGPKNDPSLFGQFVISGLLHEIFHNIYAVIREKNGEFNAALSSTLMLASSTDSAKKRRMILTKYVNTLDEFAGKKLNIVSKRKLIKQLLVVSSAQYDEAMLRELKKKIDNDGDLDEREIDELIKKYEKMVQKYEKQRKRSKNPVLKFLNTLILVTGLLISLTGIGAIIGIPLILLTSSSVDDSYIKQFRSEKHTEEYYCDLFAGMYKLPLSFLMGNPNDRKFTANSIDPEKLKKLASLEKSLYEIMCSTYPTIEERTYAATKIAKNLLENDKNLDPVFKSYCQWIIDNHSNILNTDIENDYNDNTFDPKKADDLDEHLQTIIGQNNVTLSEYDISWILSDTLFND